MIDVPGQERDAPLASDATRTIVDPNSGRRLTPALEPAIPAAIRHYRVNSLLGKGGMGHVYLAFDTRLGRQVAVKFLPQSSAGEQGAIDRFLREARAAAALNHPAICAIYSIEEYENIPFLVLEYIPGKTFRDLMNHPPENWPPSPAEAAGYMLQAAEALKAAHKAGIVHRDIKSSNLMLTADGRVKILDFGLAKFTDAQLLTQDGTVVGTPAYLSPEQAAGAAVDARTDLWSLGVAFFEILTGHLPFQADNLGALMYALLHREPESIRRYRPDAPPALAGIFEKLIERDLGRRYPSADALIADLRPLVSPGSAADSTATLDVPALQASQAALGSSLGSSDRRPITFLNIELQMAADSEDPEVWESALGGMRDICSRIIVSHEGFIKGWDGSSGSAYFGYPRAREDAACSAVEAALAIAQTFRRSSAGFSARLAVETSLAVADFNAASSRVVTGEGSSLARSLREHSESNEVLVGDGARGLVEGLFAFGREGSIPVAGGRRLGFASVLQRSSARSRFQAVREAAMTPLTGRKRELETLIERWKQAREGHGQVLLLSAPPGLGKSRLAYELKRWVAEDPSAALIECFCAPHYSNSALYPVIECIERILFETDAVPMSDEKKLRAIEGMLAGLNFPLPETVPLFAKLLGVPAPEYPPLEATPERQRALTLDALADIVLERASRQPLLFLIEDLHWADPTTVQLLGQLATQAPGVSMLAVYTHRPEFIPPWPSRSHVFSMAIDRLPREESLAIAAAATRGRALDSAAMAQIVENCDGVPLFLEEMVRTVTESGNATGARPGKLAVPSSLRESFLARLDQLGPARNLARLASVLGREFPQWLLEAAAELDPAELRACLDRLVEADVLHLRGAGQRRTCAFKHALLQEAAYDSLLTKTRAHLHQQIGELIATRFPSVAAREPEAVARHFTEAGLGERAIPFWHRAGMAALERSAHREALAHLERGLGVYGALPPERRDRAQELLLVASLGPALVATRGFGAAEVGGAYRRAEQLLSSAGNSALTLPTLWGVWVYNLVRGDLAHALEIARRMAAAGDDAMRLEGLFTAGDTLFWMGELEEARACLEAAESLYDASRFGHHAHLFGQDTLVATLCYLSFTHCFLGDFERAMAASERSIEHAKSIRHPFSIGWALNFRATLDGFLGYHSSAREFGEQAIRYCQEQAYPFWISAAMAACGAAAAHLGDPQSGVGLLRESIALTEAIGSLVIQPLYRGQLSEALLLAAISPAPGESNPAAAALAESEAALAQADSLGIGLSRLDILRVRGLALAQLGRPAEAAASLRQAIDESRARKCRLVELRAAADLARLAGDFEHLARCCGSFPSGGMSPPVLAEARGILESNRGA